METKKQTRKTSSKTKELILEVTREIAAEKGVGQLTRWAVADRAGISKGGLLYHFPGRRTDYCVNGQLRIASISRT